MVFAGSCIPVVYRRHFTFRVIYRYKLCVFLLNLHSSNRIFKQRQVLCIKTINEGVSPIMKVRKKLPGWVKRQILPLSVGLSHVLMAFNANANLSKLFCKF